jgi:hypothetical protein
MKQPEDVQLSREDGEALLERIERNTLSAEDRRVLVKVLTGKRRSRERRSGGSGVCHKVIMSQTESHVK